MTWLLMWLNVSISTLNATLQLLVIYTKIKIMIRPRSTYPKTLDLKARLWNGKMLGTHSAQTESSLLDFCDQCTPLCMTWMICCTHEKIKHKFIYECIIFFVKKNPDLLWWVEKKLNLVYKKSNMFLLCKKKVVFREKIQICFYLIKQSLLAFKKYQICF